MRLAPGHWVLLLTAALTAPACSSPLQTAMAGANVAIGAAAAGARRAGGDCYTWCAEGTRCNPQTGLCEPLPCWNQCKKGEECDDSGPIPKCVPAVHDDDLLIHKNPEDP